MANKKLQSIGVGSAAKQFGLTYAILGLVFGAFIALLSLVGAMASFAPHHDGENFAFMGAILGVGAVILMPIIYGIMGFIGGAIMAIVYNVVAKWTGGLELELSD